ncbi:hypothetical protein F2P44_16005 [Massilia sp. CCM 8695]|uniref:Uncharacterized protein n=1 Tax=Massilia frigida TaxID=2609281 RepID=A0ABX0NE13_9BURK|nr:hypothetical protein [Massilia frigida]NHZ80766.1 hypothetical protein [Massilia frigida]
MSNSFDAVSRFGSVAGAGFMGKGGLAKSCAWLQELERAALGNRPQAAASEAQPAQGGAPQAAGDAGIDMAPPHPSRKQADNDASHAREERGGTAGADALAPAVPGQYAGPAVQGGTVPATTPPAPVAGGQWRVQAAPATAELAHVGLLTMGLAAPEAHGIHAAPPLAAAALAPAAAGSMPGAALMANPAMRGAAEPAGPAGAARSAAVAAPPLARQGARSPMTQEHAEQAEAPPAAAPASGGESAADELPYALRSMHLFHDGEGVQAWIRDAALSQFQANALAYALKKEMQAEGLTLNALTLNGKKTALAPAPAVHRK